MILLIICLTIALISGLMKNLITGVLFWLLLIANHHPAGAGWWYWVAFLAGVLIIGAADWNAQEEARRGDR